MSLHTNKLLQSYLEDREVADVLDDFQTISSALHVDVLLKQMKTLQPRYFSIASSPRIVRNYFTLFTEINIFSLHEKTLKTN